MKKMLGAAAVAVAVMAYAHGSALATIVDVGDISNSSAGFNDTIKVKGAFADTVDFTLGSPAAWDLDASVTFAVTRSSALTGGHLYLYKTGNSTPIDTETFAYTALSHGGMFDAAISEQLASGGSYYLKIVGTSHVSSLSYGGSITSIDPAVPEPATWAMLALGFVGLAGIGLHSGRTARHAA